MSKPITAKVILAATAGDNKALATIAQHYAAYIATLSKRPFYDEYGSRYDLVDEELRHQIEARLLYQIVYSFDPYRIPVGEQMPQD